MFRDRHTAGEALGRAIAELAPVDPVVYGLPRGGVPVAFEVARVLDCPLDVLIVRKVGVPFQPELAMGAIAEGDTTVRNEDVLSHARLDDEAFEEAANRERVELERRVERYRDAAEPISAEGRTAIVVDDGLATGSTALAAVSVLGEMGASEVWLAVPVAPRGSLGDLESKTTRLVVLERPRRFGAVGRWYDDFTQITDDQVKDLLARSRLA
jgi:putative phosphoribosyl transferase